MLLLCGFYSLECGRIVVWVMLQINLFL
jgi:hypothetical protein